MRIRSTKPEFWRSERIATVDWDDRFVLKALESYVDDNGVGKDDLALIVGDLFQRDLVREPSRTLARVSEAISHLHEAGLVWRYEANGTRLLFVSFWDSTQRVDKPQPGRFPRPDGTMNYRASDIRECLAKIREDSRDLAPGTGEQRNRGTEEQNPPYPPAQPAPNPRTAKRTGSETALAKFRDLPVGSVDAYRIAEAFSASLPTPIETGLLADIATQIDKCLKRAIPPQAIATGLRAWTNSNSWATSQIPNFVHKANNNHPNGKATAKALGYDQALTELLQEVQTL